MGLSKADALESFEFKPVGGIDEKKAERIRMETEEKLKTEGWHKYVKHLDQKDLVNFREVVDSYLTEIRMDDINLVQSLLIQVKKAKILQKEAQNDKDVPVAQKVQTANSLANMLKDLSKIQMEIYNSERIKRMEGAIVRALKTLPTEAQEAFYETYGLEIASDPVDKAASED